MVRALYGIDVVLRIIGDDEEMDQVEEIVGKLIGELAAELRAEHARLAQLRESNGISATPRYTNPKRITVHISSPQLAQYTALIEELDRLMTVMDALWLTGVLTNKQRADGAYQWRTRVLRTGREIIEIERRARASAEKRGKGEELSEVEEPVVAQEVSSEVSETGGFGGWDGGTVNGGCGDLIDYREGRFGGKKTGIADIPTRLQHSRLTHMLRASKIKPERGFLGVRFRGG